MRAKSAQELKKELTEAKTIQLVDVREPHEHEEYNIGGVNIPLGDIMLHEEELKALSEEGEIVLYCRSGNRSGMAQKIIAMRMGITHTANLEGGILAWKDLDK
jgi:rhodanese-related sulfurtransferase